MYRTLTDEAKKCESELHALLLEYSHKMDLRYEIKLWVDNTITVDITRCDLKTKDDDDIYLRIEANHDTTLSLVKCWLVDEINR